MTNLQKISILCAVVLTMGLTACGETADNTAESKAETTTATVTTTVSAADDDAAETTTTAAVTEDSIVESVADESKNEENTFQDNDPISFEELKEIFFLGETQYPAHIVTSRIEIYFSNTDYQMYLSPHYRSNIMFIPPPSFYADNIFNVYTIHKDDDNNIYNWGVEDEKRQTLSSVSNEYNRNAEIYTLYSLDDAKQFLPDEKISQLQDRNIHWIIVTPHHIFDEYTEWYKDTYNEMYERYTNGDNIVIGWQDDWFEKYPAVWIVKK